MKNDDKQGCKIFRFLYTQGFLQISIYFTHNFQKTYSFSKNQSSNFLNLFFDHLLILSMAHMVKINILRQRS